MIVVKITMDVLAEKQLELSQTLFSLIEPMGKETGCKSCSVFCDILDKTRFCMVEEWETRKNLNHHIKSHRFGVLLGTRSLLQEPINIWICEGFHLMKMKTIEAIRATGGPLNEHTIDLS